MYLYQLNFGDFFKITLHKYEIKTINPIKLDAKHGKKYLQKFSKIKFQKKSTLDYFDAANSFKFAHP